MSPPPPPVVPPPPHVVTPIPTIRNAYRSSERVASAPAGNRSEGGAAAAPAAEGGDDNNNDDGTPNVGDNRRRSDNEENSNNNNDADERSALMESAEEGQNGGGGNGDGGGGGGRNNDDDEEEEDDGDDDDYDGYVHLVEGSDDEDDHYHRRSRRPTRSMDRLYGACATCYVVALAGIGLLAFAAVRYYPKIPEYNICNDSMAWKSLIDSLTRMSVTADFEILASISNPNHFDVALDMGRGSFTHHGVFVGTYDIPPVVVKAMSVTDMMIIAHLQPDKWDALSLTTEYYRGKLVLDVDAQANIRIPAFADYTYEADLKDIVVHVNELSDRHLCACPDWSEARNQTPGFYEVMDLPGQ